MICISKALYQIKYLSKFIILILNSSKMYSLKLQFVTANTKESFNFPKFSFTKETVEELIANLTGMQISNFEITYSDGQDRITLSEEGDYEIARDEYFKNGQATVLVSTLRTINFTFMEEYRYNKEIELIANKMSEQLERQKERLEVKEQLRSKKNQKGKKKYKQNIQKIEQIMGDLDEQLDSLSKTQSEGTSSVKLHNFCQRKPTVREQTLGSIFELSPKSNEASSKMPEKHEVNEKKTEDEKKQSRERSDFTDQQERIINEVIRRLSSHLKPECFKENEKEQQANQEPLCRECHKILSCKDKKKWMKRQQYLRKIQVQQSKNNSDKQSLITKK